MFEGLLPNPLVGRYDLDKQLMHQGQLQRYYQPRFTFFNNSLAERQAALDRKEQDLLEQVKISDKWHTSLTQAQDQINTVKQTAEQTKALLETSIHTREKEQKASEEKLQFYYQQSEERRLKLVEAQEKAKNLAEKKEQLKAKNKKLKEKIKDNAIFSRKAMYETSGSYIIESAPLKGVEQLMQVEKQLPIMKMKFDPIQGKIAFTDTLQEATNVLQNSFGFKIVEKGEEKTEEGQILELKGKQLNELIGQQNKELFEKYPNEVIKYGIEGKNRYFFGKGGEIFRITGRKDVKTKVYDKNKLFGFAQNK
jgi:hypothetical protein